jgi:hypothetical protein
VYRVLVGKPEGKRPLGRADSPGSGYRPMGGSCECGDEPSGSGTMELVTLI